MSASEVLTQQIINTAWAKAETLLGDLDWRLDHAETAVGGSISVTSPTPPAEITGLASPAVTIPTEAAGPDLVVFNQYNDAIILKLTDLYADYLATYFPLSATTISLAESWVQSAINGGSGIDPLIEQQLWERDRDRILLEAGRAEEAVADMWAARRFPLPPGIAVFQTQEIQRKAQEELSKSSREIAIKMFEVEIENVKFAIGLAKDLRALAVGAAGDYIKALSASQNTSYELSMGQANAQNGLINAVANYSNAQANLQDTMFKSRLANANLQKDVGIESARIAAAMQGKRGDVTVAAADTVGRAAAAMLNNLHTSVGVQGQERM